MSGRPEPVIRPAREADFDGLKALLSETLPATYRGIVPDAAIDAWTDARRRHWDFEDDWSDLWVAKSPSVDGSPGTTVGYVQVETARLANIWIAPAAQGLGLGKHLLDLAETVIQRRAHKQARLEVFVGNDRAQAFYESRGWSEVGHGMCDMEGHDVPGIVMVKDLVQD